MVRPERLLVTPRSRLGTDLSLRLLGSLDKRAESRVLCPLSYLMTCPHPALQPALTLEPAEFVITMDLFCDEFFLEATETVGRVLVLPTPAEMLRSDWVTGHGRPEGSGGHQGVSLTTLTRTPYQRAQGRDTCNRGMQGFLHQIVHLSKMKSEREAVTANSGLVAARPVYPESWCSALGRVLALFSG